MTFSKYSNCGCMRLGTIKKFKTRRQRKSEADISVAKKNIAKIQHRIATKKIADLLFENCNDCGKMAAFPQGAFAACKVRDNLERNILISKMKEEQEKPGKDNVYNGRPPLEGWELTPLKYNSKLMNSIWGLYNRYSVHNFKKNTDSDEGVSKMFAAVYGAVFEGKPPAANGVAVSTATVTTSQIMTTGNGI